MNGLLVVALELLDVGPGDGGFGCCPGPHKSNIDFPTEWRNVHDDPDAVLPRACTRTVPAKAGTAILFTKALVHQTMPQKRGERRTIFFKFSPAAMAWSGDLFDPAEYEGLTEREKTILAPPGNQLPFMTRPGYRGRDVAAVVLPKL